MYQRAYFPMDVLSISQGYGEKSSTHKLSYALDLCGDNPTRENVYAPFDCRVSKVFQPADLTFSANTIWLTSLKKVLCPNGYYGYLTVSITHPWEICYLKVGMEFPQGSKIMTEGTTGKATAPHIHLEVALGNTDIGWTKKKNGEYSEYVIKNKVKPEEYLFAKEQSVIKKTEYKGTNYKIKKEGHLTYKVSGVPEEPLLLHKTADFNKSSVIKNFGLKNGDEVIKFYEKGNLSYIYRNGKLGFTATKYLVKA